MAENTKRVDRNQYHQQSTNASNLLGVISVITLRNLYSLRTPIQQLTRAGQQGPQTFQLRFGDQIQKAYKLITNSNVH